jgi:hypothetical protein
MHSAAIGCWAQHDSARVPPYLQACSAGLHLAHTQDIVFERSGTITMHVLNGSTPSRQRLRHGLHDHDLETVELGVEDGQATASIHRGVSGVESWRRTAWRAGTPFRMFDPRILSKVQPIDTAPHTWRNRPATASTSFTGWRFDDSCPVLLKPDVSSVQAGEVEEERSKNGCKIQQRSP